MTRREHPKPNLEEQNEARPAGLPSEEPSDARKRQGA
jgi:hypothetical protein